MRKRVLFICLGNICRSPTAQAVLQTKVSELSPGLAIEVDSAGTGSWHIGKAPDQRAIAAAAARGYDLSYLRARQLTSNDFVDVDYILAMDRKNVADIAALCPGSSQGRLQLFVDFSRKFKHLQEVPDPYYEDESAFEQVLDIIEDAADGLLAHLQHRD